MKAAKERSPTVLPDDSLAPLESILCTEELTRRPPRAPDYATENRALAALAQALADSPRTILQKLADTILEVFQADSAGLSLLTDDGKGFYWPAIAGAWKPHVGGGTPRDFGPCGNVLDRNAPLLFKRFERRYAYLLPVTPPAEEALLIPFYVHGKAVGTIWAMAHDDRRRFDAEDLRQLESLGRFASAAYQAAGQAQVRDSRRAALNLMEDAVHSRQAMENLNIKLSEADRRKDEFLAMLAHELRNPLAPVRNGIAILKRIGSQNQRAQETMEIMERQIEHMARLLDDLLDMSRITSGKIVLRKERFQLTDLVSQAVEACRSTLQTAGQELTLQLSADPLVLHADRVRIAQVVENLLLNASKYSDHGSRIDLTVERDGSEAVLKVRDRGIGIAREMLAHIWDLFVQAEPQSNSSRAGLGIGLTVVQRLVQLHGGSVEAHSPGLGHGSEFTARLPLAKEGEIRTEEENTGTGGLSIDASPRRILIVDDIEDEADSLGTMLRLMGNEVRVCTDGPTALEAAAAFRPEVAFLDLSMPKMDGYELARRLRRGLGAEPLLVAVTGYGTADDRRRSKEAGFDEHLVKPAASAALQALLAKKR